MEGDALFGVVPYLRVSADGERVFVLEAGVSRVSVWSPEGRLLIDLGNPGQGPGDFMGPYRIHLGDSWFYVRDGQRFSYFSNDGELQSTVLPPAGVGYRGFRIRVHARLADGSFLGRPSIPVGIRLGILGDDPIDRVPLLWIRQSPDGWSRTPAAWQNIRNATLQLRYPEESSAFTAQPFSDADRYKLDPGAGTVVLARNAGTGLRPGEAELLEVAAAGDTVWQRRLQFEPIPVTRSILDEATDFMVRVSVRATLERMPGILEGRSPHDLRNRCTFPTICRP